MLEASSEIKDKIFYGCLAASSKIWNNKLPVWRLLVLLLLHVTKSLVKKTRAKKYYKPLHKWPRDM